MATPISKRIVDLFYLGGLIDNDGPQYVTAGGQAFVLPPQGESLRLELYKAEDLMRRYNTKGHTVFSLTKVPCTGASAPERKPIHPRRTDDDAQPLSCGARRENRSQL